MSTDDQLIAERNRPKQQQCVRCQAWGYPPMADQPADFPIVRQSAACTKSGRRTGPWQWICDACCGFK
jgi:hypothetical protein